VFTLCFAKSRVKKSAARTFRFSARRVVPKLILVTPMLHARHTNAIHAELPRFVLWLHVAGALASVLAMWCVRLCRRG